MSKPIIVSTTGKPIEEQALREFEASLFGEVIHPSEDRYQLARRLWNGMIDPRHPGVIVRCATAVDVARSVEFARSNELAVAVRAGGHSLTGDSFCDGGMVIDVSGMKIIQVDTEAGTARANAGLTVGEFDRATQAFGLATVLGECNSVGIAGYTLGGGLGRLMGKHGAGCDNLLSAELISADGRLLRASAEENADLFWAIRGGGGNFGIATSLEYRLHRVGQILSGTLTYPISDTREVLTFLHDYMMSVPDELDILIDIGNCGLMGSAPGNMEPIVSLALSYCGDLQKGEAALRPLRAFRKPIADRIRVMPYLEMQARGDLRPLAEFGSTGGSMAVEGGFIAQLGEEAIRTITAYIAEAPASFWIAAQHYLHGAVCRPTSDHTAFGLRRSGYSTRIFSNWREPNQAEGSVKWVKRLNAALKPFADGAMYLNYLTEGAGKAGVKDAYGSNYERLAGLKSKYDPTNFFSSNRNIEPEHS
jgi:FAD/FMN-containing dehydrogenase